MRVCNVVGVKRSGSEKERGIEMKRERIGAESKRSGIEKERDRKRAGVKKSGSEKE